MAGLIKFFGAPLPGPATPMETQKDGKLDEPAGVASAKKARRIKRKSLQMRTSKCIASSAKATGLDRSSPKKEPNRTSPKKVKQEPNRKSPKKVKLELDGSSPCGRSCTTSPRKTRRVALKTPKGRTAEWRALRRAGLKNPKSAYQLWLGENRRRIQEQLGTTDFAAVARAVGEAWAALSAEEVAPFKARQAELSLRFQDAKSKYEEYARAHKNSSVGRLVRRVASSKKASRESPVAGSKSIMHFLLQGRKAAADAARPPEEVATPQRRSSAKAKAARSALPPRRQKRARKAEMDIPTQPYLASRPGGEDHGEDID